MTQHYLQHFQQHNGECVNADVRIERQQSRSQRLNDNAIHRLWRQALMVWNQRGDCRQNQRLEIRQIRFDTDKRFDAVSVRFMLEMKEKSSSFNGPLQTNRVTKEEPTKLITEMASVSMSMHRNNALFCKMPGNSFNTNCTIDQSVSDFRHSMINLQLRRIGIVDSVSGESVTWDSDNGAWPPANDDDGCCWTVETSEWMNEWMAARIWQSSIEILLVAACCVWVCGEATTAVAWFTTR